MSDGKIINYVETDGENVLFESLPEEEQRRIAALLSDRFMEAAGFKRKQGKSSDFTV